MSQTPFNPGDLRRVPLRRNKFYHPSGPKSYVYVLNKFGICPTKPGPYRRERPSDRKGVLAGTHSLLQKELPDGKLGQVAAEEQQNDAMYLSPVEIGTPGQEVMLDFDTGSSDLWVFSTHLPRNIQGNHANFDPSKSSTYEDMPGYTWNITYGDGSSASGTCGTDTVDLGGIKVQNQVVELADQLSVEFQRDAGDGLLGLAFSHINTVRVNGRAAPQKTVVDNMVDQGMDPVFTSAMWSERDEGKDSYYTFGWIDEELVKASGQEIVYTPIDNSNGFWQFPSETAYVNDTPVQQRGNTAIADTGTTLALVADEVCEALYAAIPGAKYDTQQQGYTFPTSLRAEQMPRFSVAVGDTQFVISPANLAFAPIDQGATMWYGAVQSRGDNPFDILGDGFLKNIYAIWDQGQKRFGAVPKIEKVQNMKPVPWA